MARDKQLHIRVTEDQIARFALAASKEETTLSKWVVDLLTAATTPEKARRGRGKTQQRRASL